MASSVEFVYGDCVPNLYRPVRIGFRELFQYLLKREELDYHLPHDVHDVSIPRLPCHAGAGASEHG